MSEEITLAVIGGSGFYEMPGLEDVVESFPETPFGPPSDAIRVGRLGGCKVAFLARHGRGHRLLPSELPQRANFWALKSLGVRRVLSISAVGSLRDDYRPSDLVLPDQLIDRTSGQRPSTFFGSGVVAHISLADPFCPWLRARVATAGRAAGATVKVGGTYVVIEGPAFGTRAESILFRTWGASLVGMTALPEAKLAREAELCYATLSAVTDYDSWHGGEAVTAEAVFATLQANVTLSRKVVAELIPQAHEDLERVCACESALDTALVTPTDGLAEDQKARLGPILARKLKANQ